VRYTVDGVDTTVSSRKHANVAKQGSNELISVLGEVGVRICLQKIENEKSSLLILSDVKE